MIWKRQWYFLGLIVLLLSPSCQSQNNPADPDAGQTGRPTRNQLPELAAGTDVFFHGVQFADLDGDGIDDLITVGEYWYANKLGALTFWLKGLPDNLGWESDLHFIGEGLGGLPTVVDLDSDGDYDLIAAAFFSRIHEGIADGLAWFENVGKPTDKNPDGQWQYHVINSDLGPGIELELVRGLKTPDDHWALFSNHTNELLGEKPAGLFLAPIPQNPHRTWDFTDISSDISADSQNPGDLAPGIFGVGDITGNGKKDIILSGDGDPRVFWYEQGVDGSFSQHVLEYDMPQAGIGLVVDLDGNGSNEVIVSCYDHNIIRIYENLSAQAQPSVHDVDTQADGPAFADVGDMNGDGKLDLVVSQFGRSDSDVAENKFLSVLTVYYQGATLGDWERSTIVGTDHKMFFPQQITLRDVENDGDLDIFVPAGWFACGLYSKGQCGQLFWLENTKSGFVEHILIEKGHFYPPDDTCPHPEVPTYGGCSVTSFVTEKRECREYLTTKITVMSGEEYTPKDHCEVYGVYSKGPEVGQPEWIPDGCESLGIPYQGICDSGSHRTYLYDAEYTTIFSPGEVLSAEKTCGYLSGKWCPKL